MKKILLLCFFVVACEDEEDCEYCTTWISNDNQVEQSLRTGCYKKDDRCKSGYRSMLEGCLKKGLTCSPVNDPDVKSALSPYTPSKHDDEEPEVEKPKSCECHRSQCSRSLETTADGCMCCYGLGRCFVQPLDFCK